MKRREPWNLIVIHICIPGSKTKDIDCDTIRTVRDRYTFIWSAYITTGRTVIVFSRVWTPKYLISFSGKWNVIEFLAKIACRYELIENLHIIVCLAWQNIIIVTCVERKIVAQLLQIVGANYIFATPLALERTGRSMEIRTAIMAITTRSSIKVNTFFFARGFILNIKVSIDKLCSCFFTMTALVDIYSHFRFPG